MKILFVCKYNRLRSKIAEYLFKYHDSDKRHEVKSAGLRNSLLNPYIVPRAKQLLLQRGVRVEDDSSNLINEYLIKWADKIVVVADDVYLEGFDEKIEKWDVSDIDEKDDRKVKITIEEIDSKIKDFIENLNKNV